MYYEEDNECLCGGHYKIRNKITHFNTQKHRRYELRLAYPVSRNYRRPICIINAV